MDARKSRFAPNTPDQLCANYTRHLMCFARNGSIQRSPHPWHRLSLKFGIFICDINSNTCQKNGARTNLLNKTKIRQDHYCSSLYICHTKAMTTLVEYGTRCLYGDTNFYSVLIVPSASWLKLKSSHFGIVAKRTFICVSGLRRIAWKYFQLQQNCWYLRLRVQKAQSPHYWQVGGKNLKPVNHYKYQGAVLDATGCRDNCDKNIAQQKSCEPLFPDFKLQMQLKMYFVVPFVRPCIHYKYGGISESLACKHVAYNFGCRALYNLPWRASVSSHDSPGSM